MNNEQKEILKTWLVDMVNREIDEVKEFENYYNSALKEAYIEVLEELKKIYE